VTFSDCDFEEVIFEKCKFNNSKFKDTDFYECILENADLSDCSGLMIDIVSNKIKGAKVSIDLALNIVKKIGVKIV
ncbi:pentapeptide repeat-containing protein, partial [Cetobacterium sp.]|uniref:pentapeptide repeat-containing protein n=2 Tax=Cetobacterium sp. TaxID=2071632 RepID=UPI0025BAE13B